MAISVTAPDARRPARNPHGLITLSLVNRHKKTPALAERQNGLKSASVAVTAAGGEQRLSQSRRTEQHPAHGVDIAFDIGGKSSFGVMSRITATICPLRSLLFARHVFFENTRTLLFDAVSLG